MSRLIAEWPLRSGAEAATVRAAVVLLTVAALFALSVVAFAVRCLARGRVRDEEIDRRGSSALIGNLARTYFAWVMQPVWRLLVAVKATPTAVTIASVPLAVAAGLTAAWGEFTVAGLLFLLSGACDFLDGRVARVTGRSTSSGAALDSILDRYSECALLTGLAWFYRDSWVLAPVLLLLSGSMLVPYVRARGEGLGIDVKVGLMQRPERVVLLGLATLLAVPIDLAVGWATRSPPYVAVVVCVTALAVSTHVTAVGRIRHVVAMLDRRDRESSG